MVLCAIWQKPRNSLRQRSENFSHSKTSYSRVTQATRTVKRMRAFARFKVEILVCGCVDHLAKDKNGVKYLLVRQDLFDRTVEAKGAKTKYSNETVKTFSEMITKRNRPKKNWVVQGTEFAGEFKKFCSAEAIEVHSTMSETKAAFAERTKRSFKNILYRYMEDYGKYIHKLPQIIATMNSRKNRSIDMKPNHVKTLTFCQIFTVNHSANTKSPNLELETEFAFPSMINPSRKVKNHNLHNKYLKLLPLLL